MATSLESMRGDSPEPQDSLTSRYQSVRALTLGLTSTLTAEDALVQSMPDVSPTKWHLAHVTWFFERFVLEAHVPGYERLTDDYDFLFNSYYYTAGRMHARPRRGLLSRPSFADVLEYRKYVDTAMTRLLDEQSHDRSVAFLTTLGINHEQQHQELLLTDIKHVFSCNPMQPAVNRALGIPRDSSASEMTFTRVAAGIRQIGAVGDVFCFDNETPRHDALLHEHEIADRLVNNAEYLAFVKDGGYENPALWLADGWTHINEQGWNRPLYWDESLETEFTLGGVREIQPHAPVSHISYYEADAFARWAGARLPTEFEWEHSARQQPVDGNLLHLGYWHPSVGDSQFFGDVWEWTSSAYQPYPGFEPLAGSLGEYNGKFMCNQMSVRGGSCVTSIDHIRPSYRSFFYPDARWQFLGLRLAKDL